MTTLSSDWLRHFRLLLWNHWTEFNETWQEARSQHPLPSLCYSGWSEKQDGHTGLSLAETFSTTPLKLLNGLQRNLTGRKISTSSTNIVFFWADLKNKMAAPANLWKRWHIVLRCTICGPLGLVFSAPEPKAQVHYCDHALSVVRPSVVRPSVRPSVVNFSHFRLLLWNRWTEFNQTLQEARSQPPPPSLCFWGRSEKQDGRPGLWLAETFSTSPLKPLNRIQRNLTGSKISTSSIKFVFFGSIGKTRWPP